MVHYLHEKNLGIELIICESSSICYPIHNHVSIFTIGIVIDGVIELTIDKTTRCFYNNDIFCIPCYVPHEIIAHKNYTLVSCCINKTILYSVSFCRIKTIITAMLNEAKARLSCITTKQADLLIDSIDLIQGFLGNTIPPKLYVQDLIRQLELYPETQIYMDDMAKSAFISKYHLIRQFKEEVGLTPHQFLVQNRIRKAQRLLNEYNTITEVALVTGFYDQSHFIKHFKRIVGLTPTDYKAACIPVCLICIS